MKTHAARGYLWLLALGVGLGLGGVAHAQTTTTSQPVTATCTSTGQLCNTIATVPVTTTGTLEAEFVGSSALCSNIRMHLLVDGNEVAVTPFVGASQSTGVFNLGPVSPGSHVLGFQAEGQTGGCNSGTLGGWSGTALVTFSFTAAVVQAVPTLSAWGIPLLVALLGVLGFLQIRRREPRA